MFDLSSTVSPSYEERSTMRRVRTPRGGPRKAIARLAKLRATKSDVALSLLKGAGQDEAFASYGADASFRKALSGDQLQ